MPAPIARLKIRMLLRCAIAASIAIGALWLLVAGVQAQSDDSEATQGPDHYYYQFFGYARDITIDGEPLQEGDSITPILNGEPIKSALIPANGFFVSFKHDVTRPPIGECKVVFLIESRRHDQPIVTDEFTYPKGCGDIQVRLAISTLDSGSEDAVDQAEPESVTQEESADVMQSEPEDSEQAEAAEDQSVTEPQRPKTPRTGTGGFVDEGGTGNWPRAAAITATLTLLVALIALLVSRRTDGRT
ncbi:MAG: hypothetical protein F4Y04_06760 [Chloroflexi bacterium]|nr:hypothetical protein [Chloroflexota bacterium]